jgi:type IV secretory pathway VirB4 component
MLSLRAHRATTRHLQSLYLCSAGEGVACHGPVLGTDAVSGRVFSFDPFALYPKLLTNPNVLVLGEVGKGKSTIAKLLCWSQSTLCGRSVAVLDPKGEYGALADLLGIPVLALRPGRALRLDPLQAPSAQLSRQELRRRRAEVTCALAESGLERRLTSHERAGIAAALDTLGEHVRLAEVAEMLLRPGADMASALRSDASGVAASCREAALELRRLVAGDLAGMFDGPSTVRLDPSGPGVLVDLSALYDSPGVLAPAMVAAGSWIRSALARPGRQHLLVLDETWQVLGHSGVGAWLRQTMKLARSLGTSVVLVTHHLSDFEAAGAAGSEAARTAASLVSDTATHVLLAQPPKALSESTSALGLSTPEAELLARLGRGRALWKVGEVSCLVHHRVPSILCGALDTDAEMRVA